MQTKRYSRTNTVVYNLSCLDISTTFSSSFIISKFDVGLQHFLRNKHFSNFLYKWLQIAPILLIFLKIFSGAYSVPPPFLPQIRFLARAGPVFTQNFTLAAIWFCPKLHIDSTYRPNIWSKKKLFLFFISHNNSWIFPQ